MSQVLPWLLVGDKSTAKDRAALSRLHVRYILNATPPLTGGGVANFFEAAFEYLRLPLRDTAGETLGAYVQEACDFLQRARVRADGRVFVHCNEGRSRSAALVVAYLIRCHGKSADEALAMVRAARPQACPRDNFWRQLQELVPCTLPPPDQADGWQPDAVSSASASLPPSSSGSKRPSIGPAIGAAPPPKRPAIGPPIGPASGPAIGPARGPIGPARGPIGPARGPIQKHEE